MLPQKMARRLAGKDVQPDIVLSESYLDETRYVYVPSHQDYCKHFKSKNYFYIFVHPGFLVNTVLNDVEYQTYYNNIQWLIKKLRELNEPVILVLEKDVLTGKRSINKIFYPQKRELLLLTDFGGPKLCQFVQTVDGYTETNPNLVYSFLKKAGVKEGRFVGELAGGCVKDIVEEFFNHGFKVKGVKDCIYPISPLKKDNEILKMLYDDVFVPNF